MAAINTPTVRPERTGWRDEALTARHTQYDKWDKEFSLRHKEYGHNSPTMNLDAIIHSSGVESSDTSYVEFDSFMPKAFVEYKNVFWHMPYNWREEAWAKVLTNTANGLNVPAYLAVYATDRWWYVCWPLNAQAEAHMKPGQVFNEKEYVKLLYLLRGKEAPLVILEKLNGSKPIITLSQIRQRLIASRN